MSSDKNKAAFKICGCTTEWLDRDAFLRDPAIRLIGYQADFTSPVLGLLLFNHTCGTTVAINAEQFADLYDGPIYDDRKTGTDSCPEHCLHRDSLVTCPAKCECASIREILQIVRKWPKESCAV